MHNTHAPATSGSRNVQASKLKSVT